MSDNSDEDIDNVPDSQLVNMPASNFGAGNAGRIQNRIDRLFEESLSEDNISAYALPLFMNFKLRRQREVEARTEALEEEELKERHKHHLGEEMSVEEFLKTMDECIGAENDLLDRINRQKERLAELESILDGNTIMVNGKKVYVNGDHCVDENGNRLNEKEEAEAQRQLKLNPNAATWDEKQQLEDLKIKVNDSGQQVQGSIDQDQHDRDSAGTQTPAQRGATAGDAVDRRKHDEGTVKENDTSLSALGGKLAGAAIDGATAGAPHTAPPGGNGKGAAPSISATLTSPPGKTDQVAMQVDPALPGSGGMKAFIDRVLFPKPEAVPHGNELGQVSGLGARIADALPPKGNAPVNADKGNPKRTNGDVVSEQTVASNTVATWAEARTLMNQKVSLSSYASTLSPTPGKGDLTDSFGTAITNDRPQTASADTDAKVDKSPLATEFAAVVTPDTGDDHTADDKVTPATPTAQRQTVTV